MSLATAYVDVSDQILPETLRDLSGHNGACVSIYLPTRRAQTDISHDGLVLRNLIGRAESALDGLGVSATLVAALLDPLRNLVGDNAFWNQQSEGLALFSDARGPRIFRLPVDVAPQVRVGWRHHLLPLLPVVHDDESFHVLAVSPNKVRLLAANRSGIRELPLGSIPASMEEMAGRSGREKELQHQPAPRGRTATRFHGHGGTQVKKQRTQAFVREVCDGVRRELGAKCRRPLVLAAVSEYQPLVAATGLLPRLTERGVPGNPDALTAADLLAAAWPVIDEQVRARREGEVERARQAIAAGRSTVELWEVLQAAVEGRIDTLLTAPVAVDAESNAVDLAVSAALATGAEVHLDPSAEPYSMLALLRH